MKTVPRPSPPLERLLASALPPGPDGAVILRDLRDEYASRCRQRGRVRAAWWYTIAALSLLLHSRDLRAHAGATRSPISHLPALKLNLMDSLLLDLRFATRMLRRFSVANLTIIAALALGIGGATAAFSLVDATVLRPLPYPDEARLMRLHHFDENRSAMSGFFSPPDLQDLAARTTTLETTAAFSWHPDMSIATLTGEGSPQFVEAAVAGPTFFTALGVEPVIGRLFGTEDAGRRDDIAVLSYATWSSRYSRDPATVGATVTLDGTPMTVIGVLPPGAVFPSATIDFWLPLSRVTEAMIPHARQVRWLGAVGRLADGVTAEEAAAETQTIVAGLAIEHPDTNEGWVRTSLTPLRQDLFGDQSSAVSLLFTGTALLVLMVCTNVGGLLATQATARRRELAIRAGLGAARGRVARQLLTESLVLGILGATLGLAVTQALLRLAANAMGDLAAAGVPTLSWRLGAFAFALSSLTAMGFGLGPALYAGRMRAADVLKAGTVAAGAGRHNTRRLICVGQTALTLALVATSAVSIRSFSHLVALDPGFGGSETQVISLRLSPTLGVPEIIERRRALIEAIRDLPGVLEAAGSKTAPLAAGGEGYILTVVGNDGEALVVKPDGGVMIVTRGYFDTLQMRFASGRGFREGDPMNTIVMNQALAGKIWPDRDPVGETLDYGGAQMAIIGVVEDARHDGIAASTRPTAYMLDDRFPRVAVNIYARTAPGATLTADAIRSAIAAVDPDQAIIRTATIGQLVAENLAPQRLMSRVATGIGLLSLLLAAFGIYGVTNSLAQSRRAEFGLRLALGAPRGRVLVGVLGHSAWVTILGSALGAVGGWWALRLLAGLLYGTQGMTLTVLATAFGVVALVTLTATAVPAVRACMTDPAVALRSE